MTLDDKYVIWQPVAAPRAYGIRRFDDAFLKRPAKSLAGSWPAGAFCVVHSEPGISDPFLPDSLMHGHRRLFVSPRLKQFLFAASLPDLEYWPVKIIDRTGRPLSEPYFYVHFLNNSDCLDLAACGATASRILPHVADKLARIAFKNDPRRPLVRPGAFDKIVLVNWPLAEKLAAEGYTGFRFMGLFDYGFRGDLPPHADRHRIDALCKRLGVGFHPPPRR